MNIYIAVQNNPYLVIVLGDFNEKSKNWYGCDKINFEGNVIETLFSQFGLHQMNNNLTHKSVTYSLCIDLIFTSQPNLVVESGSPILTSKLSSSDCFCKMKFKNSLSTTLLSPVWHYQEADTELVTQAIDLCDWKKAFANISVDEKFAIFNKTILNILHNVIPHETLLVDDKDRPWLTSKLKNLINEKSTSFFSIIVKIILIYKY